MILNRKLSQLLSQWWLWSTTYTNSSIKIICEVNMTLISIGRLWFSWSIRLFLKIAFFLYDYGEIGHHSFRNNH